MTATMGRAEGGRREEEERRGKREEEEDEEKVLCVIEALSVGSRYVKKKEGCEVERRCISERRLMKNRRKSNGISRMRRYSITTERKSKPKKEGSFLFGNECDNEETIE